MRPRAAVIDTNVLVAGLLTPEKGSPTARVLEGMLEARFPFLVSTELLGEYRQVLLRPKIRSRHGLSEDEVDALLTEIVANAVVREPGESGEPAPEVGDQHLWDLLACEEGSVLVTGDQALLHEPPSGASAVSPAAFGQISG